MKKCPYCAEEILDEAILCRYCGKSLGSSNLGLGKILKSLAMIIAYGGGLLAFLYNLYLISIMFGFGGAVLAFFVAPITFTIFPFYVLFVFGEWSLLLINYGVGITAAILNYYGEILAGE